MHPALWKLCRLLLRAWVRRFTRVGKTKRGIALTIVGLLVFALWVIPGLVQAFIEPRADPATVRTNLSLGLLAMCVMNLLLSSGEKAIAFSVAEVDFLFPGPFHRRELLKYKLLGTLTGSAVMSLFIATAFLRWATWWLAAAIGVFAALFFIGLFNMALALAAQWLGELAYNRARRLVLAAIVLLLALALVPALAQARTEGLAGLVGSLRAHWAGQVAIAPFEVFSRTITAKSLWRDLPLWGSLAAAIDLLLLGLVLRLDAHYEEAACIASEKRYELLQRAQRGGGATKLTARWRLPAFPKLAGAGPVARRQAIHLMRQSPRMLLFLAIMSLAMWPAISLGKAEDSERGFLTPAVLPMLGWANFMVVAFLFPCGFRSDLDHMDWLKMLPIGSAAVVVGEVLPVTVFLAALNGVVLVSLLGLEESGRLAAAVALGLDLPLVALLVTVENWLFLLFPARLAAGSQGDPQQMGRMMILLFLRMLVLGVCVGIAAAAGSIAYFALGGSWLAATLAAAALLLLMSVGLIFVAAKTFRHFDVSLDSPA